MKFHLIKSSKTNFLLKDQRFLRSYSSHEILEGEGWGDGEGYSSDSGDGDGFGFGFGDLVGNGENENLSGMTR
jgi:hypothetical protein